MKEIIKTLIERGWESPIINKADLIWNEVTQEYMIDIEFSAKISLSDIINDNEAMRLLFGTHIETATRVWTGNLIDVVYDPHKKRKEEPRWVMETKDTPAYMTHQQQLIIMDTEEEQIAYIKEYIK